MMTVKLTPHEFIALWHLCLNTYRNNAACFGQRGVPISTDDLAVGDFYLTIRFRRQVWELKNPRQHYSLKMPPSTAQAVHNLLRRFELDSFEQSLLSAIDQAIVNFRYSLNA